MWEFVGKEAMVENCECEYVCECECECVWVWGMLALVLMMTPVQRKWHRVKNEGVCGVFRAVVAGLGLGLGIGLEDFERDEAGRRRIAAALAVSD
jgi:hypothetical protein